MRSARCTRRLIGVAGAVVMIAVGAITAGCGGSGTNNPGAGAGKPTATSPGASPVRQQSVLPFSGLWGIGGVAVDGAGTVYVFDGLHPDNSPPPRVVTLAAGADTQTVLPDPCPESRVGPLAVDTAGNIYVGCLFGVMKMAAGSGATTVLPFASQGVLAPRAIAVDGSGAVYIVNSYTSQVPSQVLKLAPGDATSTVLPFGDMMNPTGVAVDSAGNVYVTEGVLIPHAGAQDTAAYHPRVLKLAAGSSTPTALPFDGRTAAYISVAVDTAGNLYVGAAGDPGDNSTFARVLELAAGSSTPTVLPFTGGISVGWIAVDTAGNVYDYDGAKTQVVKLAAG